MAIKLSRNDPCPCGSGKKYKHCCGQRGAAQGTGPRPTAAEIAAALQIAVEHQEAGRLTQAEAIYRRLLQAVPDHPDALHLLGLMAHEAGKHEIAIELIGKALTFMPEFAEAHNNLGNALLAQGRSNEAVASYRRALIFKPDYAEAHYNLGNALKSQSRPEEALASYRRALAFKPDYAEAHNNVGTALLGLGKRDEAVASYRRAVSLKPGYADAHGNLGTALLAQARQEEALACFQQQARLEPGNRTALHIIASLTGNTTERAPVEYVERLFDGYAEAFDLHLQQGLKYDVPEKLAALVTRHSTPAVEKWKILDLGCGTGMVGVAFAAVARQLVGVDLSANMLRKARERNVYLRLQQSDLQAMMRGEAAASYDVIVAADVFIYMGKLDQVIGETARLLVPGGVFAFSIEAVVPIQADSAGSQSEYQLQHTGRYAQSPEYMSRLAAANGFLIKEMTMTQLRLERGKPTNGYLALWKNAAKSGHRIIRVPAL